MLLLVSLSGGIGSILRYLVSRIGARVAPELPLGTLAVNWTGSLLTGLLGGALASHLPGPTRTVLVTGLLGGFTTFSTFTYETAGLMEERELPWAALNFALSVLGGFAFAVLGAAIA